MARHQKKGIDYFSLDVDIFSDRKIRRIMCACGPEAMAVIVKMLCHIYGSKGYYIAADDDFSFDVADELGLPVACVDEVAAACLDCGLFDAGLYAQHGILTSQRIQQNYIAATKKRKHNKDIDEKYRLQSDDDDTESDASNAVSDVRNAQSKVKETKVKETKPNKDGASAREVGAHVFMTKDQHEDLTKRFGADGTSRMVEMLGNYKASSGKEYRSDYHAILGWVLTRYKEEQQQAQQSGRASFERETQNYDHLAEDLFADDG